MIRKPLVTKYGLKVFPPSPGASYSDFDDLGVARSTVSAAIAWAYDLMGQVGTPVIAVESGLRGGHGLEPVLWRPGGWE